MVCEHWKGQPSECLEDTLWGQHIPGNTQLAACPGLPVPSSCFLRICWAPDTISIRQSRNLLETGRRISCSATSYSTSLLMQFLSLNVTANPGLPMTQSSFIFLVGVLGHLGTFLCLCILNIFILNFEYF